MTNLVRGQVDAVLADRTLTFSYSVDAICQLEARFPGIALIEIGRRIFKDHTFTFSRAMVWLGLRDHHPEISEKEAGEFLAAENFVAVSTAVTQAWIACWPIPADIVEEARAAADPQTPSAKAKRRNKAAGTGQSSSPSTSAN